MSVDYSFTLREDYQHAVGQANKLMNSGLWLVQHYHKSPLSKCTCE